MCSGVGPMVGASCGRTAWRSIVTIDFSEAIRPPRLSTEGGVLLGIRLLKSKPIDLDKIEKKIYELAGEEFNIKSPKQLAVILFEKLELSTKGITPL